ncbi:ABC transporter ATP-binding protein [Paludibacter jiangxiensis]|uniref:Lipopolysaccharide transport system ATP-binding protein n=1 Tax=Paludibacter jiangxiensis TaxID=681398 RepID=A0A170ZNJ9_9BACT|nr:ABC transporter ATP-binding protein [Paludibacter jiangxiensis]GAT62860.1 lipopolysaccharide transport system ATP-binding protein [Paludibacter jiangxiensis]
MPTAIKFENISKQYRLGLVSTRTLSHDLNRWWQMNILRREDPYLQIGEVNDRAHKGNSDYVWALKDINFEVEQGDVVGIIGKNGAGKSTLLKILSKVTAPTTGSIKAKGRIASLLEVGTGFHPEMTGRENIYMNGAIMGMRKSEIDRKFDEIVDFAGVERYIDTPVKRYSSGMTVRLGFAVAAFLEPEILVVDEVLAVGDAEFQKKAIGKMQDVSRGEGRTVLFVSHNMAAVRSLCNRGVILFNGNISFDGNIEDAVEMYLRPDDFSANKIIHTAKYHIDTIKLYNVTLNGNDQNVLFLPEKVKCINYRLEGYLSEPNQMDLEARMYDKNWLLLGVYAPSHINARTPLFPKGSFILEGCIQLPENITHGQYWLSIALSHHNVAVKVTFQNEIRLEIEGVSALNGRAFDYKDCGFLMLK